MPFEFRLADQLPLSEGKKNLLCQAKRGPRNTADPATTNTGNSPHGVIPKALRPTQLEGVQDRNTNFTHFYSLCNSGDLLLPRHLNAGPILLHTSAEIFDCRSDVG